MDEHESRLVWAINNPEEFAGIVSELAKNYQRIYHRLDYEIRKKRIESLKAQKRLIERELTSLE